MTTEDDFQAVLDRDPDDAHTRLVFADWLDERGDPRGPGHRALGVLRLKPMISSGGKSQRGLQNEVHGFTTNLNPSSRCDGTFWPVYRPSALPDDWYQLLRPAEVLPAWDSIYWTHLYSRREAENAAALVFARLPAARRAELLATEPEAVTR